MYELAFFSHEGHLLVLVMKIDTEHPVREN